MNFFCHLPWTAVHSPQSGIAKPCCVFRTNYNTDNYLHNPELIKVKQTLLQGQTPKECKSCAEKEIQTGYSFRLLHQTFRPELQQFIKEKNDPEFFAIRDLSVISSGICNLKCLPCFNGSFIRMLELKSLGLFSAKPETMPYNFQTLLDNESLLQDIEVITITGGEPFYDKVTFEFLQKFVEKYPKHKQVSVHINTNLTHVTKQHLDFLSENFGTVLIKASIDGIGPVNDYLRYPSCWSQILQNFEMIKQRPEISLVVTSTVTAMGLLRMYEVIQFCIDQQVNLFFTPVTYPEILQPNVLPDSIKQELLVTYQQLKKQHTGKIFDRIELCIDTAIQICQSANATEFNISDTIAWCQRHDQIRNNNLFDVFPELKQWAI